AFSRFGAVLGVVLTVPQLGGCNHAAPAAAEKPVPKVTVMAVRQQETIDADEYTGRTEASKTVEIRSRLFGYLKTIEFQDGDFVEAGKTLFTIEPDEYEAIHQQSVSRIDLNAANLELAKAKLARDELLVKSGAVSKEEYEESIAAVKSSEAAIAAARADANRTAVDLKYTVIKAPIAGRIDRALVSEGNLLTGGQGAGTPLTKIISEQPMYVYFDVDERSLLRYMRQRDESRSAAPGSLRNASIPCYLQLADETDFHHAGVLDFVESEVNPGTGTTRLRGVFPNDNRALASGLFVRVKIPVSKPYPALLVPEQALATDQSIKFVYVVGEDRTAERRLVELGSQRGEFRIIKSGLTAGELVIVKGLQRVKPGQKVEMEVAEATLPTADLLPAAEPTPRPAPSATGGTEPPLAPPNPAAPDTADQGPASSASPLAAAPSGGPAEPSLARPAKER
ncbi:MAG: efflux RND transporter periplasmic adaptor subunit, partial [Pirellulaceae bacterium]